MTRSRAIAAVAIFVFFIAAGASVRAQQRIEPQIIIEKLTPDSSIEYNLRDHTGTGTNGVLIRYNGAVLTANAVRLDSNSGEADAQGQVRIQQGSQIWIGQRLRYNFKTRQMIGADFRTGKAPFFAAGEGLTGDFATSNRTYTATHAMVTSDDISQPAIKVRASRIRITPNRRIEAWNGVLYLGDVPVFYFPYYRRNLGPHANNFNFIPGYRSTFGPFILGNYTWYLNDQLDGILHLDYRERRGVGVGPDFNYHLGRWGEGSLRYYYTHDEDATTNFINAPVLDNRQRLYFSYQAEPFTNLEAKSLVRWQNDAGVVRDFFVGEYRQNPQPDTYFDLRRFWENFSVDAYAQPRVDPFYETVARLPQVTLTGFRQQIGDSPLYYESENSFGYYERLFAETNGAPPGLNFDASRADTYHQITLPETFFGWLNIAPRAGGRFTYYSQSGGPAGTNDEATRGVFNTGAEVSFKASRVWPGAQSRLLDLDGLRHIIRPSVNYVYVPSPNVHPSQLPQFDYELPSLRLLPIEFPEYNSIDSIDSQNVIRWGLENKLQTKRKGRVEDFLDWQLYTDWRLRPRRTQETFADLYSDLTLRPRSWITFDSQTRFDLGKGRFRMALDTITLTPNDRWSWTVGSFFLRDDFRALPTALGPGNNVITSSFFYRLNENWGLRTVHHFDARNGRMQEQYYTIYRDLRSWTAALTGGVRDNGHGPLDYSIAFTFSFKAFPRYGLDRDTVRPYSLLGL